MQETETLTFGIYPDYPTAVQGIAKVCHEANKAYCQSIGDDSQKNWEEAEEWQRESAIKGVDYKLLHPHAPPSAQHEAWLKDKLEAGWKYGPVKNPETKEHPCCVSYQALPIKERVKDAIFGGIVKAIAGL